MPPFRVQGKRFLLTWSQFESELLDVFNLLDTKGSILKARIARELHQDGNTHIHAAVEYTRKLDSRRLDFFDLNGKHPNIKPKRTNKEWRAAWSYCAKAGDYLDYPEAASEDDQTDGEDVAPGTIDLLEEALAASSYTEYLQTCYEHSVPYGYSNAMWQSRFGALSDITDDNLAEWMGSSPDETGRYPTIRHPRLQELRYDDDGRTWIIEGATQIGKSEWAKLHAPKPALWVTFEDTLARFRPGYHRSIIFDDYSLKHVPRNVQLHYVDQQNQRQIRIRYKTITLPRGVVRFFTCNPTFFPVEEDPAIKRRYHHVQIFEQDIFHHTYNNDDA